jgi:hypothetical protein
MGDWHFNYSVDEYRIEELESMLGLADGYVEVEKKTENLFLISIMNHQNKESRFLAETHKKAKHESPCQTE